MFDSTAFFINLLKETFVGIKAFLVMAILLLVAIANVIYIFSLTDELTMTEL